MPYGAAEMAFRKPWLANVASAETCHIYRDCQPPPAHSAHDASQGLGTSMVGTLQPPASDRGPKFSPALQSLRGADLMMFHVVHTKPCAQRIGCRDQSRTEMRPMH